MSPSKLCLASVVALGALTLACASTARTIQGRSVYHNISGDVREVSPGHVTGPWKTIGVSIDDVTGAGEEAHSWIETGTIDMVWRSPTELVSCTNKSTQLARYRDGSTMTVDLTATCKLGPDGKLIFEGRSRSLGGIGRFDGAQFTGAYTAYQLTKGPGDIGYAVYTTTFTKPPKK